MDPPIKTLKHIYIIKKNSLHVEWYHIQPPPMQIQCPFSTLQDCGAK